MALRTFRKIQVTQLSANFRQATRIVESELRPPADNEILIKNHYVGINASDINFTSGKYLLGVAPPFDAGFESLATIEDVGKNVKNYKKGDSVAVTSFGAFSEYQYIKSNKCVKVPSTEPSFLPLLVSGLTASLALECVGNISTNQTVLVTAAAGATGSFAVQIAKLKGNHVIGTCSSDDKVAFLKSLGCDRVINYKKESLDAVLTNEYPKGVDIVYESVGGDTYETCVNHLAVKGTLIIIGMISSYQDQSAWSASDIVSKGKPLLSARLLQKSAAVKGFFLFHFLEHAPEHMQRLVELVTSGKLVSPVDPTTFIGLEDIPVAIDHMYSGKNVGKVVVKLNSTSKL